MKNEVTRMQGSERHSSSAWLAAAIVLLALGFGQPGYAASDSTEGDAKAAPAESFTEQLGGIWNRDLFTGDWQGWRTTLQEHGIDVGLRLSQYGQYVATGGVNQNGEWGGTLDYRITADLKKLLGLWDGFSVTMHARTRFGTDVTADAGALALENTGLLMPAPGNYRGTDVTGLLVNQMFPLPLGRVGLLSLGKIDVVDAVTLFFPHVGFGQEGFLNTNALVTSTPWLGAVTGLSLYGGWLATTNMEYGMGESAFLFTGTKNVTTSWTKTDSFEDGAWMAAFHRFFWKLDDKTGYLMIFAGGSTREQNSNDPNSISFIPNVGFGTKQKRPWDIAVYLYQVLWQAEGDPNRKATILIAGTGGPEDPQLAQWNVLAAVEAYGPMASRPLDRMGVSGWYSGLSNNFINLAAAVGLGLQDTWGVEAYYNVSINKWLHLTSDLQVIQNPRRNNNVAVIPGVRIVMDF